MNKKHLYLLWSILTVLLLYFNVTNSIKLSRYEHEKENNETSNYVMFYNINHISEVKCKQKYDGGVTSPLNSQPCYNSLYNNHSLTTHTYLCLEGANTVNGCQKGIIKIGHDCNNQYYQPWEFATALANLPYASDCPKQQ
jgi:hypothetical protein